MTATLFGMGHGGNAKHVITKLWPSINQGRNVKNRIYLVEQSMQLDGKPVTERRLVEAGNQAAAIKHVAQASITCQVATQRDLIECTKDGIAVETAGVNES
jgi:hypothetical protein